MFLQLFQSSLHPYRSERHWWHLDIFQSAVTGGSYFSLLIHRSERHISTSPPFSPNPVWSRQPPNRISNIPSHNKEGNGNVRRASLKDARFPQKARILYRYMCQITKDTQPPEGVILNSWMMWQVYVSNHISTGDRGKKWPENFDANGRPSTSKRLVDWAAKFWDEDGNLVYPCLNQELVASGQDVIRRRLNPTVLMSRGARAIPKSEKLYASAAYPYVTPTFDFPNFQKWRDPSRMSEDEAVALETFIRKHAHAAQLLGGNWNGHTEPKKVNIEKTSGKADSPKTPGKMEPSKTFGKTQLSKTPTSESLTQVK